MGRKKFFLVFLSLLMALAIIPIQPRTASAVEASFRAAASSNENTIAPSVVVPGSVQSGDQLVLVVTANKVTSIDTPAGWTLLGTEEDGSSAANPNMTSAVFTLTAGGGTGGSTVTVDLGERAKAALSLVAYSGAEAVTSALSSVIGPSSADLTTPAAVIAEDDTTVVSYWSNKTSDNTGWVVPPEVTERDASIGSGNGRITAAIGDSVADTGDWDGATATATSANSKGIAWTILVPTSDTGGGGNVDPTAALDVSCTDLDCDFDASGSSDSDGTIVSYDWDFGDGTLVPNGGPTQSHTYSSAGDFTVTVTVTDNGGGSDSTSATASPSDPGGGNVDPTADLSSNCTELDCTFDASGSSDSDGTIVSYDWDFGDGTLVADGGPLQSHTYAADGEYTVTVTVTDDGGLPDSESVTVNVADVPNGSPTADLSSDCTELDCTFDASGSSDSDGTIVSYDWDFGDGTLVPDGGPTQSHMYLADGLFDVTVTVTDNEDATDSATDAVDIANVLPTAAFTFDCDDLDCTFDASGSSDVSGTILSYDWDFGDGTVLLDGGPNPAHSYLAEGLNDVVLTVIDDEGSTDDVTISVDVVITPNADPTASFTADCTDLDCTFDASDSVDSDGTIVSYDWDFGDGNVLPSGGIVQAHTYAADGTYDVVLTVTDDEGATNQVLMSVQVEFIPNLDPTATFTFTCDELDCAFDATASDDPDGIISSFDWDFGDGTVLTDGGSFPEHTFAADGDYTVTLTVTDDEGGTDADAQLVAVINLRVPPDGTFTTSCEGLVCTFNASASTDADGSIVSFAWDFGDGDTSTEAIVENNYPFPGSYDVELVVTDDDTDTDTVTQTISVDIPGVPTFSGLPPDTPRLNTPYLDRAEITDLEHIGNLVYVVGAFGSIRNDNENGQIINQGQIAAFDIDSGDVFTTFDPSFSGGGVTEIARSPDGSVLYVVGRFESVNGNTKLRVAAIDPITGNTITSFTANTNSAATSVAATGDTVYIGGQFTTVNGQPRGGLAAVDATTGQLLEDFRVDLTGGNGPNGLINVQAMVLSDDMTRLLVVNTARQMDGQDRYGIGLIDTASNELLPWRTRLYEENLSSIGGIQRLYTGDIAPNGEYFVVGSGSGGDRPPISDTAVAFPMEGGDFVQPLWVSRMFDSVYSLAITEDAVFAGGHMNYVESPTAPDPWPGLTNQGYGRGQGLAGYGLGDDIVIRDHITAISPVDGKAIEWNPGTNSREGNKAMIAIPRGIVTGGDARTQGGRNVGSIAFYDLDDLENPGANNANILWPIEGRVEATDEEFIVGGTATAVSGVDRVQLEVIDMDSGQYLQDNLTTWGSWNAINAPLMSPGATETVWNQPLVVSGNRRIRFLARAFGESGGSDPVKDQQKIETFGLSDETPTTNIQSPFGIVPELTFTVTGSASDDLGISSVRLSLRDSANRYLQDDGSVDDIYNTFTAFPDVIGAPNATWSYEITVPYEGEWTMEATAVDTSGQSDLRASTRTFVVNTNAVPPEVAILTPVAVTPPFDGTYTVAPGQPMTFTGSAIDDQGLRRVEIRLRNRITDENLSADGQWGLGFTSGWHRISPQDISGTTYNWSYTTPFVLTQGRYELEVRAVDDDDLTTSSTFEAELDVDVEILGDSPPDARLDVTGTQNDIQVLHLDITGTATDDIAVADVLLELYNRDLRLYLQQNGTLGAARARVTGAVLDLVDPTSVTWSYSIDLPAEGEWDVTAYAVDTAGQLDTSQSGASARYVIYPDDNPPTVTENLLSPTNGTVFTEGRIAVSGRVEDDIQIADVEVAIINSAGQYMRSNGSFANGASWRDAFVTSPGSPGSNFSYTTPVIPDGDYTVLVRGVDHHGFETDPPAMRTASVTSPPNDPPVAAFTYTCDENVCTFDGRSSTDESPLTLTYSWNFGNGSGSGPVPQRTYTSAATYTVTLTVTDEWNAQATTSQDIVIVTPAGNLPPVPEIFIPPCNLLTCNFSSLGSEDPNGDNFSRLWEFGDGDTSGSSATSHTYDAPGTYTVMLTLTDGWGASATASTEVTFTVPGDNVAPVPVIETPVCTGLSCSFSSINSFDPNSGDTFTRLWDFGDGATSSSTSPSHLFAGAGTYTVTLTVTDVWLAEASTTIDVTVSEP